MAYLFKNVRPETIKLLGENIGGILYDINSTNIFWDLSHKARETESKINKLNLIKLKNFYTAKETINKTKRKPTEWEKIFANDMSDKRLMSKIYKQFIQLNIKKPQTTQLKLWPKTRIDNFAKKTYRWSTDTGKDAQHH